MASQSRSDASRANGAKSKGPATPEGKARSSQNALKHGLTASFDVLPGESQDDFDALLDAHVSQYQPSGAVELELVRTLAITRWRLRRVPTFEFNVLENETILREEEIDEEFSSIGDLGRLGFVFRKLADHSQVLNLLIRYEASLTRVHDRNFKHLTAIQKLRNEPKPPALVGQAVPPADPRNLEPAAPPPANTSGEQMRNPTTAATLLLLAGQAMSQQFEVASVKPNRIGNAGGEGSTREKITATPGSLIMHNVSLQTCIKWAYGLRDFQISGGPSWLQSERYDITAKAPDGDVHQMLRALLADRFKLSAHLEKKNRPVYELVVAKGGPKLQASTKEGDSTFGPSGGELVFRNYSMSDLADRLASRPFKLDLPVLDRTGLDGRYDFSLKLASNDADLKHTLEGMEQGPSIFVFFQEQLGLKLESRKTPIEVLIIESIEKVPSGN